MAAFPTAITVEMGLGGSYRQSLINEASVTAVWPLHELSTRPDARAHDITGHHYHGTFVGTSGFTRGVSSSLPEGALGMTFDGNGYIEVPDDSAVTTGGAVNLSLAGGDIDETFLCQDIPNDATNRAVIQKQETNSTGNGWHISIQNGAVEFYLKVAGVVIFNFQRGAISGATERLVHCSYRTSPGEAKIFIDGVQSGATVSGVTTEPAATTANLRIGAFTNGVAADGNGLKGTFWYVMIGREGNATLAATLQATRSWSTLAAKDLHGSQPIVSRYGIGGNSILDLVGQPGRLTFALNNGATNSARTKGYYTPGHASVRSGFRLGIPVRLSVGFGGVTHYKARGRLTAVEPQPGEWRAQAAMATVTGWLDVAANTYLPGLPAQTTVPSHEALKLALDESDGRSPAAVAISSGSSEFAFALDVTDGDVESILSEASRVTGSERGYLYEKGDIVRGGTLAFEGRGDRQTQATLDATFSATMHGLEVAYDLDNIVNVIKVSFTPREVDDAATTVLYALEVSQASQPISPGEKVVFENSYRDPAQQAVSVGATELQSLVAGTDYGFWANDDGTGADMSGDLGIAEDLGGSGFRLEFTNNSDAQGFLRLNDSTAFQIRGKGIYHYSQTSVESRDRDSVRQHGPRTVQIELPYESSRELAQSIGDFYLGIFKAQRPVPDSMTIHGWVSSALLTQVLAREPGDKIGLVEAMTGLVTDDPLSTSEIGYIINEVELRIEPGRGQVSATWRLAPTATGGTFWLLGTAGASELDQSTVLGV